MPRTRLISLTASTAVVALLVVAAVYALSAGSDNHVSLEGIDMDDLDLGGGELLVAQGDPILTADQAVAIVRNVKHVESGDDAPDAEVRETRLVRFVNDTKDPPTDTLAWAVNLTPETVPAVTPCRGICIRPGGPVNPNPTPTPEPTPLNCGRHTVYDVILIDARTGEWLYEAKSTELGEPAPSETCPPTPVRSLPLATPSSAP